MEQIERVQSKLNRLRELDKNFSIFGAKSHEYKMNPALTEEEIKNFENQYQITLPEDYKLFLTHIGDGGAGPYYGLETLEYSRNQSLDYPDSDQYNDLSQPFPLSQPYNPIQSAEIEEIDRQIDEAYENGDEDLEEKLMEKRDNLIWEEKHNYGILNLSNYGCGISIFLVVNGKEYGNMWTDDRVNDGGIYPSTELGNEGKINFLDWYELWLDESIKGFIA